MERHHNGHDTAARHMSTNFCAALENETVFEYLEKLKNCHESITSFPYIYVVDTEGILRGVISLHAYLKSPTSKKIRDLMEKVSVTVHPETDREHVAALALTHQLKAVPVVDRDKKFLGIVSETEIFRILHEEHVEDFLRSAGVHGRGPFIDVLRARLGSMVKVRLPWLFLGLAGGMLAVRIVEFFETSLQQEIALAFFIPVIVYMADAVGTQTETIFIRTQFMGHINTKKYILRETGVGAILGFILGAVSLGVAYFFFREPRLAAVIGLSMFVTVFISVFVAMGIPMVLLKAGKDPEVGSGPFATVLQDILSIVLYFLVATLIL